MLVFILTLPHANCQTGHGGTYDKNYDVKQGDLNWLLLISSVCGLVWFSGYEWASSQLGTTTCLIPIMTHSTHRRRLEPARLLVLRLKLKPNGAQPVRHQHPDQVMSPPSQPIGITELHWAQSTPRSPDNLPLFPSQKSGSSLAIPVLSHCFFGPSKPRDSPISRQGSGKDLCVSMPSCASICTLNALHNPFADNKKPRNKGFRGASQKWLITTACSAHVIEFPLFFDIQAFPGKVPARILSSCSSNRFPGKISNNAWACSFPISLR